MEKEIKMIILGQVIMEQMVMQIMETTEEVAITKEYWML